VKYFVQYPIKIICSMREVCGEHCYYCLHKEAWDLERAGTYEEKFLYDCPFTFGQYQAWRDKHLPDATEIIMELHGGEMSYGDNRRLTLDIIDAADKERFSLQTNGIGDVEFYKKLIRRKDKIERIGFTYHRAKIRGNQQSWDKFVNNVRTVREAGIKVYVKELLIPELRDAVMQGKMFWENIGVEFRIQDYRGVGGQNPPQYTPEDIKLMHPEYQHIVGAECACRRGYKNIIIRGYDINAAVFGGDVLACWHDPTVIGNINNDWYNPSYTIYRRGDNSIDVVVPQKLYRGNLPRDRFTPENVENFGQLNINQLKSKQRSNSMTQEKLVVKLKGLETEISNSETAVKNAEADVAKKNEAIYQEKLRQIGIKGAIAQLKELIDEETPKPAGETKPGAKKAAGNIDVKKKPAKKESVDYVP